jgi:hypothetical protein
MTTPIKVEAEQLAQMRERGGTWAAYQNVAMDSSDLGRLQFLKFGPGCTYETRPEKCPDTAAGLGWKYKLVGTVDLETGEIL